MVQVLNNALEQGNLWMKEVMHELRYESDRDAYAALRAVLHTLRDRLTVEEAAHLAAQLPLLLKGIFYDGWRPSNKPEKMNRNEFLLRIKGQLDTKPNEDPERVFKGIMNVIASHITLSELDDIVAVLPKEISMLIQDITRPAVA